MNKNKPKLGTNNRFFIIIVALVVLGCLTLPIAFGYTTTPHIYSRVLLESVGIDKTENGIILSAEILFPAELSQRKRYVTKANGKSVREALDNMSSLMGRMAEMGHCRLIVIGKDCETEDIVKYLQQFIASSKAVESVNIVYTDTMKAYEFMEGAKSIAEQNDYGVNEIVGNAVNKGVIPNVSILRLLSNLRSSDRAFYVPIIELTKEPNLDTPKESGGDKPAQSEEQKYNISNITKCVVFSMNKPKIYLGESHIKGLIWQDKFATTTELYVASVKVKNVEILDIPVTISRMKKSSAVKIEGEKIIFTIKLKLYLKMRDNHKLSEAVTIKGVDEAELGASFISAVEEQVRGDLRAFIVKAESENVDLLGVSDKLDKYYHQQFASMDKDKILENTEYVLDIKVAKI